jgi:hypothetical protein
MQDVQGSRSKRPRKSRSAIGIRHLKAAHQAGDVRADERVGTPDQRCQNERPSDGSCVLERMALVTLEKFETRKVIASARQTHSHN